MQKVKPEFVEGAVKVSGATTQMAETFWDQLEEFANYCFNKSHAACYGLIAYWTAYLKAHYPDAFMAALMTSDRDNIDRLAVEIAECNHMGITVMPPDVNESFVEFAVVPGENKIRFGMAAIKGVGVGAVEEILRARDESKFSSVEDFAKRVSTSKFNRKAWESLIKSGGFDSFGDRSDLLFNLETVQGFASKVQKDALSGQTDLFGAMLGGNTAGVQATITLQQAPTKHTPKERLTWERELLGLYISAHPLDDFELYLEEQTAPLASLVPEMDGKKATIGGIITTVRTIMTKSGSRMAFVGVEDKTSESELIIFPELFKQIGNQLAADLVIRAEGKLNARDRDGNMTSEVKMIADTVFFVTEKELREYDPIGKKMVPPKAKPQKGVSVTKVAARPAATAPKPAAASLKKLFVHIKDPDDLEKLKSLKDICAKHAGQSDIILVLGESNRSAIKLPFRVDESDNLINDLVKVLGEDAVKLK